MSKLILCYGSDRTGKSTYTKTFTDANWKYVHFSKSDYSELLTTTASHVIADRGYLERFFYDKLYRNEIYTQAEQCEFIRNFEKQLALTYSEVESICLWRPWDDVMILRHLNELYEQGVPHIDINVKLSQRAREHELYYQYMNEVRHYSGFTFTYIPNV